MKRCPNCGHNKFYVTAHVTQDWLVDENGTFEREIQSCIEVTHYPDDDDIWDCAECGHSASGYEFNVEEEE